MIDEKGKFRKSRHDLTRLAWKGDTGGKFDLNRPIRAASLSSLGVWFGKKSPSLIQDSVLNKLFG